MVITNDSDRITISIYSSQMSSYFVNSLSACYGQTMGIDSCSDGSFHRNGNYQHTGAFYPGFPSARYPYPSKEERLDDNDYYGGPRLSHLPPASPCGSPHSLNTGTPSLQTVHPMHERPSCNIRTGSNNNSYYHNGHIGERNRSSPSLQAPSTSPSSQPPPGQGSGPTSPTSPRSQSDQQYNSPQIYPWMRRMQYTQGEFSHGSILPVFCLFLLVQYVKLENKYPSGFFKSKF